MATPSKPKPVARAKSICGSPSTQLNRLALNSPSKPARSSKTERTLPRSAAATSRPASPVRTPGLRRSKSTNLTGNLTGTYDDRIIAADRPLNASPHKSGHSGLQRKRSLKSTQTGGVGKDVVQERQLSTSPQKPGLTRKKSQKSVAPAADRFIPNREASGAPSASLAASQGSDDGELPAGLGDDEHTENLTAALNLDLGKRILSFSAEPPPPSTEQSGILAQMAKTPKRSDKAMAPSQRRRIATMPTRVLDAPGLVDDYYLNLLDWSITNKVAVALEHQVYLWHADTGDVAKLCELETDAEGIPGEDYVCSVKFSDDGAYLAIGTSEGPIQIYDVASAARIRTMAGHLSRVSTLAWSGAVLSSGSRDGVIVNSDVRLPQHKVNEMRHHRGEVCGLQWRKDLSGGLSGGGQGLLASGANDNVVNVWDGRNPSVPRMTKNNHTAAVKAVAWCPWQSSLLATGGGTNDKTIHFWNTTTSARLNTLTTNSQVTSIVFNPHAKEFVSSHGSPDHQLSVWAFPSLQKIADINQAHDTRILHTTLSPDGCNIATASSDENLKFWNIFVKPTHQQADAAKNGRESNQIGRRTTQIR